MVYLNRIYTRTGDEGITSLGDGQRVSKTHPRIRAYGGVDELNATLGLVISHGLPELYSTWLRQIQHDLFDVGADLCVPETEDANEVLRVVETQVERLEGWIDQVNEKLEPLTSFILPGGSPTASFLHQARTVCRRVEIGVLDLTVSEPVNHLVIAYLNRLSDLLFVLARDCNNGGSEDVLWSPASGR